MRLINESWTATLYAVEKSSRWSALLTSIYRISTVGRELSPVVRKHSCFGRSAIKILTELTLTQAIFYHPEPFFLGRANKGSGKFGIRYSLLSGSLKFFYYHSLLLSIRHLSQDKRRKGPQRNRSNKCWDKARHHARTPRNFIGGNPTGSAVKTNGRAGTRTSGSSKGSPELGLANDSRELLTNKKTANAVLLWSKFWAYQLKTAWSRWDTIQRWCAIRGTTRSTNGQSSDIQPEGASNNITVVGREILPRKASNLSINSRTACSRISPYWVEWHDVSKIQRIGRSPWSNKWQIKIKPININYITRKFYVHSLLWRSRQ